MEPVRLSDKLAQIDDHWHPRIIASLNGQDVKLAKLRGEFVWHHHADADELFLVLDGDLLMRLRDGDVELHAGDLFVVPRGVEHQPVADGEVAVLLFEPSGTLNTGNVRTRQTVDRPERL